MATAHYSVTWARARSKRLARVLDGTPLVLMELDPFGRRQCRPDTMVQMHIQDNDVMFAARDHGYKTLRDIDSAILERNGEINVVPTARSG